ESADIIKARQELDNLKVTLKETLGRLMKAQARLRELGADPGEQPVLEWRLVQKDPNVLLKRYTISKPVQALTAKLSPQSKPQIELGGVERRTLAGKAVDPDRLKLLEKRLKDLQDEVDRLKKGAGQGESK